jgi:hypothetical protein
MEDKRIGIPGLPFWAHFLQAQPAKNRALRGFRRYAAA